MCQQAIEKLLKAIIIKFKKINPPYSHNLRRLAEIAGIDQMMQKEQIDFLDDLTPFCVATRYPAYKEKMSKIATSDISNQYLNKTKELQKWLSNLTKQKILSSNILKM